LQQRYSTVCTADTHGIQLFPRFWLAEKIAPVRDAGAAKGTMDGNKFPSSAQRTRMRYLRWNLGQEPPASGERQTADLFVWPCAAMFSKSRSKILYEEYGRSENHAIRFLRPNLVSCQTDKTIFIRA
jgi:hypothetical protein